MFFQLMLTMLLVWGVAEALCRVLLRLSPTGFVIGLLRFEEPTEPKRPRLDPATSELEHVLEERQQELERARARLDLAQRTAELTSELADREGELRAAEARLAQIEELRDAGFWKNSSPRT